MKLLSVFSLILGAGLAISQVNSTPLRVIKVDSPSTFIRVGHAAANRDFATPFNVAQIHTKPKHRCGGRFRNKAKKLMSWFAITFHLTPPPKHDASIQGGRLHPAALVNTHGTLNFNRPHGFVQRLTHALMTLSPWEGRAVAFILGCGIGVLIRMVWVLVVVAIRSIGARRQRDEFIEDEVLFEEEERLLGPPQYTVEQVVTVTEKEEEKEDSRA